jgi:hypothetical protein
MSDKIALPKESEGACKGGGDGRQDELPSHPMLPRPALHLGCLCVRGEGLDGGKGVWWLDRVRTGRMPAL